VSVGLVVLLAWQLVQLTWTILGARKASGAPPAGSPGVSAPAGPSFDLQTMLNAHLFGVAGAPDPGATDPNAVAATQMNLVLVGTIAESNPERGYAIIGDSAATAKVYAVGKTITGGTKLHSVYPDRAILDRGGRLEALLLPRKFTGAGLTPPPALPAAQGDPMLGDQLRNLAAQNPGAITEIIRPQPVFANGQQRGYRVYPGRNRTQFTKLGLMPGDLVTAINGTPLDDAARGMEVLQTMNYATDVTVTVERNGQTTQININNAQVAADAAAAAAMPEAIPVSEMPEVAPQQDLTE
jgi:general secretion pathway protein C